MDPRISAGDLVLYYRLDKKPVAGDVIICKKNGKQYVGRVVGKGGDSVEVTEEATVKVNGSIVLDQNIFYETPQYESEVKYAAAAGGRMLYSGRSPGRCDRQPLFWRGGYTGDKRKNHHRHTTESVIKEGKRV